MLTCINTQIYDDGLVVDIPGRLKPKWIYYRDVKKITEDPSAPLTANFETITGEIIPIRFEYWNDIPHLMEEYVAFTTGVCTRYEKPFLERRQICIDNWFTPWASHMVGVVKEDGNCKDCGVSTVKFIGDKNKRFDKIIIELMGGRTHKARLACDCSPVLCKTCGYAPCQDEGH